MTGENPVKKMMDSCQLKPELDWAMDFLHAYGPTVLIGFDPMGRASVSAWNWDCTRPELTREWLEKNWKSRNLHFHVNYFSGGPKKATKADIPRARRCHADYDARPGETPQDAYARIHPALMKMPTPPTWVISSGHGVNAVWNLVESAAADDVEAINYALAQALGDDVEGDACWNVDRVLRLPGTINWPNKTKIETKGQEPQLAGKVYRDESRVYEAKDMPRGSVPEKSEKKSEKSKPRLVFSEKPLSGIDDPRISSVSERCRLIIRDGYDPVDPDKWAGDRSRAVMYVTCQLIREKIPPEVIAAVLTDPKFGVSAHVLAQSNVQRYVNRQINRALESCESFDVMPGKNGTPGAPHGSSFHNVAVGLAKLEIELSYDEFNDREVVSGLDGYGPDLDDVAVNKIRVLLQEKDTMACKKDFLWDALSNICHEVENRFHPVKDYLESLKWDGVSRVERLIPDFLAGPDTDFSRDVGLRACLACVGRVFEPGYKFDQMVILEGVQGDNKSTALEALAVRREWFSDSVPMGASAREFMEATTGKWILEDGELNGYKSASDPKAMLSRKTDRARGAYKRTASDRRRQFVVFGTTNEHIYLNDSTGNRRFWAVKTGKIDIPKLVANRDQIWAEATARWKGGERPEMPEELWVEAKEEISQREVDDPWENILIDAVGDARGRVAARDVLRLLEIPIERRNGAMARRCGNIMRKMGFEKLEMKIGTKSQKFWVRGNVDERFVDIDLFGYNRSDL
jgi:hypothetical protein